jgi:hypothetical protein
MSLFSKVDNPCTPEFSFSFLKCNIKYNINLFAQRFGMQYVSNNGWLA